MIFSDLSEQWGHFLAKTFLCIRSGAGVSYRHACFAVQGRKRYMKKRCRRAVQGEAWKAFKYQ